MTNYGIGFKYRDLSSLEQEARLALIERVIKEKRQLSVEEAIDTCGGKELFQVLKDKNIFAFMDEKVTFLYPVSAVPTNHHVKLSDGRDFFSMCAVDALGVSSMFHLDVEINSICSESGDEVYIKVSRDEILEYSPKTLSVLHVDLTKESNWAYEC